MAAQAGKPGAIDEILALHRGAMFRAARRFTDNHEDAEDLVQDAMLRAFVNIQRFRKESRIATWLVAIVNNAALSLKRRAKLAFWLSIDGRKGEEGQEGWDFPNTTRNPEQEIIRKELLQILSEGISRQCERHQACHAGMCPRRAADPGSCTTARIDACIDEIPSVSCATRPRSFA